MSWLLCCLGAGLGAPLRFLTDHALRARYGADGLPLGTLAVNVAGSLALGLLAGLGRFLDLPAPLVAGLGAGFCGGLTTWSTLGWETLALAERGRARAAAANLLLNVVLGLAAAALGYAGGWLAGSFV